MSFSDNSATGAATPPPSADDLTKAVLRDITEIVSQTVTAVEAIGDQHLAAHQRLGIHVHELAEDLAGSTIDWIRRWPS